MEKVKCLLCGGTMPADDLEVQIEHMLSLHKATSKEEAQQMAKDNFVNPYRKDQLTVLPNGLQITDRRKNPRKKLGTPLILNPLNTADSHRGWMQDISMGGIRVKTQIQPGHLAIGEDVTVLTNTSYLSPDTKGKVIWTSDIKGEVGIKFIQLAEETRKSLEEFLKFSP